MELKLKAGCKISGAKALEEGYEVGENCITANVSIDKIEDVMLHFLAIHEEPIFFILELPANADDENEIKPGVLETLHKDVYYIDGCSVEEAMVLLERVGNLLYNDGLSTFGFGGHESEDEILFGKYNVCQIYTQNIDGYVDFFEPHEIERTDNLITGWDVVSPETPGICSRYDENGKSVYDIPKMFEDWGIYLAEQREE